MDLPHQSESKSSIGQCLILPTLEMSHNSRLGGFNGISSMFRLLIIEFFIELAGIDMGNCECSEPVQELPDVSRLVLSKVATTRDFYTRDNLSTQSQVLSESIVYTNLFKVANGHDLRISSGSVRSRLKAMPLCEASETRNLMKLQEEIDLPELKAKYVGQTEQGSPHGYGKLYFYNGNLLQGTFVDGRAEGKGRLIKSDGNYYEGDLKNNTADGYGVYIGENGFKYEGQWKVNLPNGTGDATYPDGARYVGEFLNNKRHGKGTLYDGEDIYKGEFKFNQIDGELELSKENGQNYQGQWKQNQKHGNGIYSWPNGTVYSGEYFKGKRHGKGKIVYPNGDSYQGEWIEGKKHGEGEFRSSQQHYIGTWKKGKLIGISK